MSSKTQTAQSSLYLLRRVEAMIGLVRYFLQGHAAERQLQFLAQSDFWDWEMENLIYSFVQFEERQKTWGSFHKTVDKLGDLGILMDTQVLQRFGRRRSLWLAQESSRRVAPVALLKELIDDWNRLIDQTELHYVAPMRKNAERYNIQTRRDLNTLRKRMPATLDSGNTEERT